MWNQKGIRAAVVGDHAFFSFSNDYEISVTGGSRDAAAAVVWDDAFLLFRNVYEISDTDRSRDASAAVIRDDALGRLGGDGVARARRGKRNAYGNNVQLNQKAHQPPSSGMTPFGGSNVTMSPAKGGCCR